MEIKNRNGIEKQLEQPVRKEVRNMDNKLVFMLDEATGELEHYVKGCVTLVKFPPGTNIQIANTRKKPST